MPGIGDQRGVTEAGTESRICQIPFVAGPVEPLMEVLLQEAATKSGGKGEINERKLVLVQLTRTPAYATTWLVSPVMSPLVP